MATESVTLFSLESHRNISPVTPFEPNSHVIFRRLPQGSRQQEINRNHRYANHREMSQERPSQV